MTTTNSSNVSTETSATEQTVSLRFEQEYTLRSQEGRRGRPRKRGQAYVRPEIEGAALDEQATRRALAAFYGIQAKDIAFYRHNDVPGALLAFIIPCLDKDTGHTFVGATGALGAAKLAQE